MTRTVLAGGCLLAWLGATAASAAEETFPRIDVVIPIEIENDLTTRSDDPANERNDLFATAEPEITVHIVDGLTLFAHAVFEPVQDPDPGEDRYFDEHGLFVEDLYLKYETDPYFVQGGKFTPNFGRAWNDAPGVYGTDFAEAGYELAERIGLAGGVTLGGKRTGRHVLTASTFFLDTTSLSESAITSRRRNTRADGGPGNTENLSSFAAALDGRDIAAVPGFTYHAAVVYQDGGAGSSADEKGVALAVRHEAKVTDDIRITPLVEYVTFVDADGVDGRDRDFLTLAARLDWTKWNLAVSYTARATDEADGTETDDFLFQVSAGYAFDMGLAIDFGWRIASEDRVETQTVGVLLAYTVAL